jgi:hypothetical protein
MIIFIGLFTFATCLAILALEDAFFFEIKLEILPLLAGVSFILAPHFGIPWQESLMGGLIWAGFPLLIRVLGFRMAGQGDIWLLLTAGLFVGITDLAATTVLLGLLILVTAAIYARLRGKRGLRSIVPLAVPLTATLFLLLEWRLIDAIPQGATSVGIHLVHLLMPWFGGLTGSLLYWMSLTLVIGRDRGEL